jgi:hypothetical protein
VFVGVFISRRDIRRVERAPNAAAFGEIVPQRCECDLRHELSAPVIREI